jgi:hypothetical protein
VAEKDARERLDALERVRVALAHTKAEADELHERVSRLLERSVADEASAHHPHDPRPKR